MGAGFEALNDLEQLKLQLNTQLGDLPLSPRQVTAKIAWTTAFDGVLPTKDGDNKIGTELNFSLAWPGEDVSVLRLGEDPGAEQMERVRFSMKHEHRAPKKKVIPEQTQLQDVFDIFRNAAPTMVKNAYRWIERYTAALLGNGQNVKTLYDNVQFFHATDHLANPNRKRGKKFGNLLANTTADRAGYESAAQLLDEMPGPDGRIGDWDGRMVALTSNRKQFRRLRGVANGTIVPSEAGTASETNIYSLDGEFDVIYWPELKQYDSGRGWYLLKICGPMFRPFVVSIPRAPFLYMEGVSVNDHSYVLNSNAYYGWKMVTGHGYLFPQLAVKCIEPAGP